MKYFYLTILTYILVCCISTNSKQFEIDKIQLKYLNDLLNKSENLTIDNNSINFNELDAELKPTVANHIIYLLNSDCSVCIGQFMNFLFYLEHAEPGYSVIVIVNESSKYAIEHYLKQARYEINVSIKENTDRKYLKNDLEKYNGEVFVFKYGKLMTQFLYLSVIDYGLYEIQQQ